MARRGIPAAARPAPAPVTGAGAPLASAPPVLPAGEGYGPAPAAAVAAPPATLPMPRAPALLITVHGDRAVFACGRWFQPGVAAHCRAGYFSTRQEAELRAHPGLSVRALDTTAPCSAHTGLFYVAAP